MKVYVLTQVWQCDYGDFGNDVMVFYTIEKAQKELAKLRKLAIQDFKNLDAEQDKFVDGDMAWSIWEREDYAYNHIDLTITENEVI